MPSYIRLLATPGGVASRFWLLLALSLVSVAGAQSANSWDLRVCADPDNMPYSNRAGEGYENGLAQLIATELGATLSYAWMPAARKNTDAQLMLRLGECDLVMSVADGVQPFLNTISYYTGAAYFVTKKGSSLADIASLDDPRLATLRVGVDRGTPLDFALQRRLDQRLVRHYLIQDRADAIMQDVASGALDVGVVRGAVAGYFLAQGDLPLNLIPVMPEVDIPFLTLVQPITLGVRRGDDALRDQLNRVLTRRWDDVQTVLDDMNIARPQVSAPRPAPAVGPVHGPATVRVGVILPSSTGASPLMAENVEPEAGAARNGALLADALLGGDPKAPITTFLASAPTAEVADRAAHRLAALDRVSALLGGVGEGQGKRLAEVAGSLGLPFMNVADPSSGLRTAACASTIFNVAPDYRDYLSVMSQYLDRTTPLDLLVVRPATPEGRLLEELLRRSLAATDEPSSMTTVEVAPQEPYYGRAIEQIRATGASAVVLLIDADEQLVFLGQYETAGLTAPVLGLPTSGTQLRQYYWTLARDARGSGTAPRFAMWDASISPSTFNDAYRARFGQQSEAASWAAYVAVQVLQQAALLAERTSTTLLRALMTPNATYDVVGSSNARFDSAAHQLRTPVYVLDLEVPPAGVRFEAARLTSVVATLDVGGGLTGQCH